MGSLSAESPTIPPTLEVDTTRTGAQLARGDSAADDSYNPSDPELSEMKSSYPPTRSQEAETRRVEETLRQWEIKEKQRRKVARESTSSTATASYSLLDDVTKRASLLWRSGNRTRNTPIGGKHMALGSTDNLDTVSLGAIPVSPTPTPSSSIVSSPQPPQTLDTNITTVAKKRADSTSGDHDENNTENPFDTPENSIVLNASPFSDEHQVDPTSIIESHTGRSQRSRPSLSFDHSGLGIPAPSSITSPPERISSPNVSRRKGKSNDSDDDSKPVRWWHEWLCGCGEGSDRGGDNQAGRTNPYE